ncbi:MAG: CvpA family protein [Lachnospira sp.]
MVLICVIALLAISCIWGYKQGVIKIAISLASLIITIAVSFIVAPIISKYVIDNTTIDEKMSESVYEVVSNNTAVNDAFDSVFDKQLSVDDNKNESILVVTEQLGKVGQRVKLPKSITDAVSNIPADEFSQIMSKYNSQTLKEVTLRLFCERITKIIVNTIIYLVVLLVVYAALRVVIFATGIVNHLPLIKQANRLGGLAVGFIQGILIVWIFFAVLTAFSNYSFASSCLADIHSNSFLEFIYDNNIITKLLIQIVG